MRSTEPDTLHVAVAIIKNVTGNYLVSQRQAGKHLAGLWEFPGGKCEPGESVESALIRECEEELGITISQARPLIRLNHQYPEKRVLLDTWLVEHYQGEPHGLEGQAVSWQPLSALHELAMPAADKPILTSLSLPDAYHISPDPSTFENHQAFLYEVESRLKRGVRMLQLRMHHADADERRALVADVMTRCQVHDVPCLFNTHLDDPLLALTDGLHLTQTQLMAMSSKDTLQRARQASSLQIVAASCHDVASLQHAEKLGVDFAVLSPVKTTHSHPERTPLGWSQFSAWLDQVNLPVYALGGMTHADLTSAWQHGAQGIACLDKYWQQ